MTPRNDIRDLCTVTFKSSERRVREPALTQP
jgi:hypothetical protein